jgi:signal transduction histidine kinase
MALYSESSTRFFSIKQYTQDDILISEHLTEMASDTPYNIATIDQEKAIASLAALSYRTGELDDYLKQICQAVLDVLGDGAAAVTLYRNGKKNVIARVPHSPKVGTPLDVHGQLSTFVVESGKPLRVSDALENPQYGNPPAGFCSYLGMPLKLPDGKVVGTLCYFDKEQREYTQQDEQVASLFAERIAIALDNYELYLQLKSHSDNLESLVEERTKALMAAEKELMHKEKLAALGEFASHLTHEIRNPLATIKLALEYFERQDDERAVKRATLAGSEISRLERMLNEVLTYASPTELNSNPLNLSDFLDDFLSTNDAMLQEKNLKLVVEKEANPRVSVDADKLSQVLLNLFRNAYEASESNQDISWKISTNDVNAELSIHNGGDVIPEDKLVNITDAFVSTKTKGTGLGLAIVKNLVEAHQGELTIQSSKGEGTLITLRFPLVKNKTLEGAE